MNYIKLYFEELINLMIEMAPWLVLGFVIAGILHVFFPQKKINRLLGGKSVRSVVTASLLGIPLPLCSCGVIPTGVSIYKNGASKGSSVSFLISTPQTGVDSIMVTYSLLGWPFAILRPVVALVTGVFGGIITNFTDKDATETEHLSVKNGNNYEKGFWLGKMIRYAFVDFLEDIAKWLVIGLLVAAFIAVLVPDDFFAAYIHNDFIGMLIILAASVPVYVCATSSVPIAAVLIMKGLSPGAALVFLMAGPATNAATISVIGNAMGRKTLISYLATIIAGALLFGLLADYVVPRDVFTSYFPVMHMEHVHQILPGWLHIASAVILGLAILNIFYRWIKKVFERRFIKQNNIKPMAMNEMKVLVKGMTCNHCKSNVETHLANVAGVEKVSADVGTGEVIIEGDGIDLDKVKEAVEGIGYIFSGKI